MSAAGRALKLGVGASPGSGMAKVLLWGVVLLLGFLVRTGYSECNDPSIDLSTPENSNTIRLHCCVNRSVTAFFWTHNGYRLPATIAKAGSRVLEVPIKQATGVYECHVEYGATLSQIASIVLDFSANKKPPLSSGMVLIIVLVIVFIVSMSAHMAWFIRRHQQRYTLRGRRYYRRDSSSDEQEVDDGANHATAAV